MESSPTSCGAPQRKKRFSSRWSLRHLIYSSPLLNRRRSQSSSTAHSSSTKTRICSFGSDGKPIASPQHKENVERGNSTTSSDLYAPAATHHVDIHLAHSRTSIYTTSTRSVEAVALSMECPLCLVDVLHENLLELSGCGHRSCVSCLQQYLRMEISESRVSISCPECSEPIHPNEIRAILDDSQIYEKYEDFMVRRVLAIEPDTRWCPAPDCSFAVIASECASCPKLKCERPGCDSYFCYHCKAEWHPNQTCDAARAQRSPNIRSSSVSYSQDSQHRDDIKPCPRCQVLIVKMDDGSCNHMMCAVCGAEFCWLCMKEISDLHYLSPSGCTFWGKKPWSRKKKILWQLGTLVGAPVGIALVAGITVPAMIIGIPVWVGRKMYTKYKKASKRKRNAAIIGGVLASIIISPILAGLAVGIGVPILLFYVYGVVPVSLCRSGGCGGSSTGADDSTLVANSNSPSRHQLANGTSVDQLALQGGAESIAESDNFFADHNPNTSVASINESNHKRIRTKDFCGLDMLSSGMDSASNGDGISLSGVSNQLAVKMGDESTSLSLASGLITIRDPDRESASLIGLAGSIKGSTDANSGILVTHSNTDGSNEKRSDIEDTHHIDIVEAQEMNSSSKTFTVIQEPEMHQADVVSTHSFTVSLTDSVNASSIGCDDACTSIRALDSSQYTVALEEDYRRSSVSKLATTDPCVHHSGSTLSDDIPLTHCQHTINQCTNATTNTPQVKLVYNDYKNNRAIATSTSSLKYRVSQRAAMLRNQFFNLSHIEPQTIGDHGSTPSASIGCTSSKTGGTVVATSDARNKNNGLDTAKSEAGTSVL